MVYILLRYNTTVDAVLDGLNTIVTFGFPSHKVNKDTRRKISREKQDTLPESRLYYHSMKCRIHELSPFWGRKKERKKLPTTSHQFREEKAIYKEM